MFFLVFNPFKKGNFLKLRFFCFLGFQFFFLHFCSFKPSHSRTKTLFWKTKRVKGRYHVLRNFNFSKGLECQFFLFLEFCGRTTGFEPASNGVTVHCLTTWLRPPCELSTSLPFFSLVYHFLFFYTIFISFFFSYTEKDLLSSIDLSKLNRPLSRVQFALTILSYSSIPEQKLCSGFHSRTKTLFRISFQNKNFVQGFIPEQKQSFFFFYSKKKVIYDS